MESLPTLHPETDQTPAMPATDPPTMPPQQTSSQPTLAQTTGHNLTPEIGLYNPAAAATSQSSSSKTITPANYAATHNAPTRDAPSNQPSSAPLAPPAPQNPYAAILQAPKSALTAENLLRLDEANGEATPKSESWEEGIAETRSLFQMLQASVSLDAEVRDKEWNTYIGGKRERELARRYEKERRKREKVESWLREVVPAKILP